MKLKGSNPDTSFTKTSVDDSKFTFSTNLSPVSVIPSYTLSLTLWIVLSIEESNLFSAESVTLAFNEVISSFKESANNAEVKNLILTHFSARYKDELQHKMEAEKIHNSVITAKDLLEVEIN